MNNGPAMTDLRYPIGPFQPPDEITAERRAGWIAELEELPMALRGAVAGLSEEQLETPYRPGGWTLRQVVHHVPDSHLNAYIRCKWALTEDEPTIKTYEEARWAELADYRTVPIAISLDLLTLLHRKWTALLRALDPEQWERTLIHPELGRLDLGTLAAFYAWHGRHHLAHVTTTAERLGW